MKALITNSSNSEELLVTQQKAQHSQWINYGKWRVRPGNHIGVEVDKASRYIVETKDGK